MAETITVKNVVTTPYGKAGSTVEVELTGGVRYYLKNGVLKRVKDVTKDDADSADITKDNADPHNPTPPAKDEPEPRPQGAPKQAAPKSPPADASKGEVTSADKGQAV